MESQKQYKMALEYFEKANSIEAGYCVDDVKRVNYILRPDIQFLDLIKEDEYLEAIGVFEDRLSKSSDIDLIEKYISALYSNNGTENKALTLALLYSKSNSNGDKLFFLIAFISKYCPGGIYGKNKKSKGG